MDFHPPQSPKKSSRRVLFGLAAAFVIPAIIAFWTLLYEPIPPRNFTSAQLSLTKRRIIEYARAHDALPPNLAALPPLPANEAPSTVDAWGRPLDYSFDASGVVTLRSLGADKAEGGTGDNRDMIGIFPSRDGMGAWQGSVSPWLRDPSKD